jgi:hypothetical protein
VSCARSVREWSPASRRAGLMGEAGVERLGAGRRVARGKAFWACGPPGGYGSGLGREILGGNGSRDC